MIFLTVGTQFAFDRLVRAVDAASERCLIDEDIFAQIGESRYKPKNFDFVPSLNKASFDKHLTDASAVIAHAGMGTITMALNMMKPLLVMPRLAKYKEVVHDHQVDIAEKFGEAGHILVARDETELPQRIVELRTFIPAPRVAQPEAVSARIKTFLDGLLQ